MMLPPQAESDASFYERLEQNRSGIYAVKEKMRLETGNFLANPYGEDPEDIIKLRGWKDPWNKFLLHSYSSFLVRSVDGDEQIHFSSLARMNPKKLQLNPHHYIHAGVFIYGLGAFLQAAAIAGYIKLNPDIKYFYRNPQEMAKFFITGRLFMILMALLSAWLLFWIGKESFDAPVGHIAAFIFLAAPATISVSHIIKGHIVGTAMTFALMALCMKLIQKGSWRWYAASSFGAGMIFGTQPHLWFACLAVPLAHLLRGLWVQKASVNRIFFSWRLWLMPVIGIAGFIAVSPYIFTDFTEWYQGSIQVGTKHQPYTFLPWLWVKGWFIGLGIGMNYLILFVATLGLILYSKKFHTLDTQKRFLLIFTWFNFFFYLIYTGQTIDGSGVQARRFVPLVGLIAIYAAWLLRQWAKPARRSVLIYTFAVALFLCHDFYADAKSPAYYRAGHWINENVAPRTSIGIKSFPHTDLTPPFDFSKYELWVEGTQTHYLNSLDNLPEYFVIQRNPIYYSLPVTMPWPFPGFEHHYELVERFGREPHWWDFTNHFNSSNFPNWIYKKREQNGKS